MDKKDLIKQKIINLFKNNVQGINPNLSNLNKSHDGAEGHWLEIQLGKIPDANNRADFWGFECKSDSKSKTTWGDWTANYRIYHDKSFFLGEKNSDNQDQFVRIFGRPNPNKNNRYSWSGISVPTRIGEESACGQILIVDEYGDISIYYSFSKDTRNNKEEIMPEQMQLDNLLLMKWYGTEERFQSYKIKAINDKNIFFHKSSQSPLEQKVLNKFGEYGWFKCIKDEFGNYEKIKFGDALTYIEWLNHARNGDIYFDSGMYEGNPRPYSSWRSNNKFWENLATSEYL